MAQTVRDALIELFDAVQTMFKGGTLRHAERCPRSRPADAYQICLCGADEVRRRCLRVIDAVNAVTEKAGCCGASGQHELACPMAQTLAKAEQEAST